MRVVVALDERWEMTLLAHVPQVIAVREAEVVAVHVLDPGGREEWERAARRHLLRSGSPHQRQEGMHAADRHEGERLLARAAAAMASWGAVRVETLLLEGSPKHEIRALLGRDPADALIIFVHGQNVGPSSIGKEARFLLDHAPCAVVVMKG